MAKIKDTVQLKSGYANFVELKSAFEAARENADRIAMYRPTKVHRKTLERIRRGLYQPNGHPGDGQAERILDYRGAAQDSHIRTVGGIQQNPGSVSLD